MASNPYETLLGEVLGRRVARTARGIPAKPTPKKNAAPPAPKPRSKTKGRPEDKAPPGRKYGPTPQRAIAEGKARRAYLDSPRGKEAQWLANQSRELDRIMAPYTARSTFVDPEFVRLKREIAEHEASKRRGAQNPLTGTTLAGFDPSRFQGVPGGKSVGGLLQNLGRGAIRTITDAPLAAQLGTEALLGAAAAGVNLATGNTGPGGTRSGAQGLSRAMQDRAEGDLRRAGRGIVADYKHRWGPLSPVGGEGVGVFGQRFYEDPLPTLLDAAGAYSAAGRTPAAVARGLSVVSKGRTAEALANFGSRSRIAPGEMNPVTGVVSEKGGKLYRAPRTITSTASRETPRGNLRTATNTVEIPRRPYSVNVITRQVQRGADQVRSRIVPKIEAAAERRQPAPGQPSTASASILRHLTPQAKFDRAQRRGVRDIVFERDQLASGTYNREVAPFARAVRSLKPDTNAAGVKQKGLGSEHVATTLHLMDVLAPRAGMTARQLRDLVITKMEATLVKGAERARREGVAPPRIEVTRQNIAKIRAIPDELLELSDLTNPAVKRVLAAVQAGRELDAVSQAKAIRAGIVSAKTAQDIKGRAAGLLLGGQEWGPALLKGLRAAGASKAEIAAVRRSAITETPKLRALRGKAAAAEENLTNLTASAPTQRTLGQVYRAGRKVGRADIRLTQAPRISTRLRRQPVLPRAGETARAAEEAATLTRTQVPGMPLRGSAGESRPLGITAGQGRQYAATMEGQATAYQARTGARGATPAAIKAATRKRDKYLKAVRAQEERHLGLTPPTRPEMLTGKGAYIPKKPADVMGGGGGRFGRRKGFAGPPKPGRETGLLTQSGNFDLNPALLAHAAKRATEADVGPISDAALREFTSLGGYTDDAGALISGKRAVQMARTDPTRVVLIHKGKLRKAMSRLDDLEDGKTLEPGEVRFFYGEGKEPWLTELPKGPVSGEYIAVSKAAADVWRESATTVPFLKATDTLMTYFKGGILALSPRWFLNSAVGVASQYGLLAGLDVKSIRQANKLGAVRNSIPDRVVLNNLAHEMGMQSGINPNRLRKVFNAGFRANDRIESVWRRGAFVNRAKKALRDEGVRTRGMSNAEIAHAIDHMPPSLAQNIFRDVDLFLGEFRKFNKVERDVIRRVVPWYSWLRVITRLTFSLPYRSPIRAAAISTLGRAGEAGLAPDDYMRPIYQRGDLVLGNGIRIPTGGLNSPATLLGPLEAGVKIAANPSDALGVVGEEGAAWVRPELQTALASMYGTNAFGGPLIAPSGYAGSVPGYGGAKSLNPASGLPDSARARVPFDEALLQAFGGAPVQALRKFAAGGNRPFDTQRTLPMLAARLNGGDTRGMFLDPAKRPVRQVFWQGMGSTVGVNPVREDPRRLEQKYREQVRELERALRRQAAKNKRRK